MAFTDTDARRSAVAAAAHLPCHLPDALAVLRHMEIIVRYRAGYLDAPGATDENPRRLNETA
jgi:hypothetical protein